MENNWLLEPTRQFSIQMNFINYDLGIIMTLYVAMQQTALGMYTLDYATIRVPIYNLDKLRVSLIIFLNFCTTGIILLSIRHHRKVGGLFARAQRQKLREKRDREAKRNAELNGANEGAAAQQQLEKLADISSSSSEESELEKIQKMNNKQAQCTYCCIYLFKCKCFWGATCWHVFELIFIDCVFIEQILLAFYKNDFEAAWERALSPDEFVNFHDEQVFFQAIVAFGIFGIMAISIITTMNTVVRWLPETFTFIETLLFNFFDANTMLLLVLLVAVAQIPCVFAFFELA